MNVLMVLDSMASGGTETHVLSIAKKLKGLGIQVAIVGNPGSFEAVYSRFFKTYLTDYDWSKAPEQEWIRKYKAIMTKERISLVHVHQTPSGLLAAIAAKELGIPLLFTVHGTYYPKGELVRLLQEARTVISVSNPIQEYLQGLGFASQVIPNGVDIAEYSPTSADPALRERFGISKDAFVLLYVSRLAWQKGTICKMLLRAAKGLHIANHTQLEVLVVGEGPQWPEIRELSTRIEQYLNRKFIHLVGQSTEMPDFYRMSDAVVGTGRVALEAMACGKPVLAAGNHGFFGWVEPGVYKLAWDCYFGDHQSLRSCTLPLMTETLRRGLHNTAHLHKVGQAGRDWVLEAFNAENVSKEIVKVYEQAIQDEGRLME
ncbi:glycosyltransferase [Paenibacillus silviterrae]|uniref:glycosyltransferase n=1 Tax=Paenibacillus silviterrae TaxID=3242194 RepID=UPI002543DA34|nr:glycosyltransferase [Paenibacillus chinjuensis]